MLKAKIAKVHYKVDRDYLCGAIPKWIPSELLSTNLPKKVTCENCIFIARKQGLKQFPKMKMKLRARKNRSRKPSKIPQEIF